MLFLCGWFHTFGISNSILCKKVHVIMTFMLLLSHPATMISLLRQLTRAQLHGADYCNETNWGLIQQILFIGA